MSRAKHPLIRWVRNTSNRTFVLYPVLTFAVECLLQRGWPRISFGVIGLPVMLWGCLQYNFVRRYRLRVGGGGPGLSTPPERLVTRGPYAWTRNPIYLGQLLFIAGTALLLQSWFGLFLFVANAIWFHRRVLGDEAGLAAQFGEPYRRYMASVKRWIPGVL